MQSASRLTCGTPDFAAQQRHMHCCMPLIADQLRFMLGEHFEQRYPASGVHADCRAMTGEAADLYREWMNLTLHWRLFSEQARMNRT